MKKRQKRGRLERAHAKGYLAGINGKSKEMCPWQTIDASSYWLAGGKPWRTAQYPQHKRLIEA